MLIILPSLKTIFSSANSNICFRIKLESKLLKLWQLKVNPLYFLRNIDLNASLNIRSSEDSVASRLSRTLNLLYDCRLLLVYLIYILDRAQKLPPLPSLVSAPPQGGGFYLGGRPTRRGI